MKSIPKATHVARNLSCVLPQSQLSNITHLGHRPVRRGHRRLRAAVDVQVSVAYVADVELRRPVGAVGEEDLTEPNLEQV